MITAGQGFTTLTLLPGGNGISGTFPDYSRMDVRNLWMLESSSWSGFKNWPLAGTSWTPPPVKAQAAGATPISIGDAGSGADSIGIAVKVGIADAGSGTDGISVGIKNPVSVSDSGAGSEALEILRRVFLTEAGSGLEALAIVARLALADAGSGADAVAAK